MQPSFFSSQGSAKPSGRQKFDRVHKNKINQYPGWQVIAQGHIYEVKQVFTMVKRLQSWAGGEKGLAKAYPKIKVQFDSNVVIDNRVIASNGGSVSYQAAFILLAKLRQLAINNTPTLLVFLSVFCVATPVT